MRKYLTNMPVIYMGVVQEAVEKSSRYDICVDPEPILGGATLTGYFSIYVDQSRSMSYDCSDFWQVFDKLEQDPKWSVYLNLTKTES